MRYVPGMRATDISATSAFSRAFATHLRDFLDAEGVTQDDIRKGFVDAGLPPRSQAYVSERLRGLRAVDTDFVSVAATLLGKTPRGLVSEVLDAISTSSPILEEGVDLPNVKQIRVKRAPRSHEAQKTSRRKVSADAGTHSYDVEQLGAVASTETNIEPGDLEE